MLNQPDWVTVTFIGAIIGYILPYIIKFVVFIFRKFQHDTAEGSWFVYHPSNRGGKLQIEKSAWRIGKGIFNPFVVRETREGVRGLVAKGSLYYERNFWLIRLKAIMHDEEVSIRLFNPISTADEIVWGLYLSLDFQGNPIAGPVVISRKELSPDEMLQFLSGKLKVDNKMKLITL